MNRNKRVAAFTLLATFTYFISSLWLTMSNTDVLALNNINLIADIVKTPGAAGKNAPTVVGAPQSGHYSEQSGADTSKLSATDGTAREHPDKVANSVTLSAVAPENKNFDNYRQSKALIGFNKDTAKPALPALMHKLVDLKNGKHTKVRIAWFGDSMIEGDLLTKTFRKRMQQFFGGYGVGFVPATSITAPYRNTVVHQWKGEWKEENFKSTDPKYLLYLSGHTFFTGNGQLTMTDKTVQDSMQVLEKCLLCGATPCGTTDVTVNGRVRQYRTPKKINRLVLDSGRTHFVDIGVRDDKLPVYGVSMEPESGVVVDNFSFRGITGLELGKLDTELLSSLEAENKYDLVVLEYGANLMFRPNDVDYSWYQKHIMTVISKLRRAMPHSEFLIISTADRAFKYGSDWKTAAGMDNLVRTQAELAYTNDAAFFNMYNSMGGSGTIVQWADAKPALANKDYIHPNILGADILGNILYDAFMKDYRKLVKL